MSDTIKQDERNYRVHSDSNKELIKKSLLELGAGRSILIDNGDQVIAGNATFEQAKEAQIPMKVIETTGDELIVVKRTDLNPEDEKRKLLAIVDNKATDESKFDMQLLQEDTAKEVLIDWGFGDDIKLDENFGNQAINPETDTGKKTLKLEFTESDYDIVIEKLESVAPSPEEAILKLIENL